MNMYAKTKNWLSIGICITASAFAQYAYTNTLTVPADFPTIQSAVNAAVDGDMILVAPGTYYENINISTTAVHLLSETGPEATIIDGGGLAQVIRIEAVPSTTIEGFTIQNGNPGSSGWPAGVWIYSGLNITIKNNIVRNNACDSCVGLGIGLSGYRPGPVLIENNIIENNSGPRCGGGGIGSTTSAIDLQIVNNTIRNNHCNLGGGIYLRSTTSEVTISNNEIRSNSANLYGGGLWSLGVPLRMTQNLIADNSADQGGGVYIDVENLIGISTNFTNNTVANNDAVGGEEIYLRGDLGPYLNKTITLVNNSITGDMGAVAFFCDFSSTPPILQLSSNNIYSNTGAGYGGSCTDIYTGVDGNISKEPEYLDDTNGDYQLDNASPMIDAGNNSAIDIPINDLSGNPRIIDGDGSGIATIDIGAYEKQVSSTVVVLIDIKPGNDENSINSRSNGQIPVAIITTGEFDALQVDPDSVLFGTSMTAKAHSQAHVEDVDNDGDMDLQLHFKTQETGIQCGDTEATLSGNTWGGTPISGTDSVNTVGCK